MTDPTTKDLIEEARSRTCVCSSHELRNSCNACVCDALAERLEAVEGLAHPSVAPVVDAMLPRLDQLQAVSEALVDRIEDGPDGEVQARLLGLESRVGGAAKDRGNLLRDVRRLMWRVEEIDRQMPPEVS